MSKNQIQIPEGTAPYKKATLKQIDEFVVEEGFNKRKDFGITQLEADRLARTFQEDPYKIPPVTGFRDRKTGNIVITDGERRVRLARKAGVPSLPFIPTSEDLLSRLEQQATSNSGKSFTDVENAELADALSNAFLAQNPEATAKEVRDYTCGVMNISQATFYNYASLFKAPQEVQVKVQNDEISLTAVRQIMSETSSEEELIESVNVAIEDAKAQAAEAPQANPGKGNGKKKQAKATKSTLKKGKTKKVPFAEKSYNQKLAEIISEVVDSPTEGAKMLIQLDAALKGDTSKQDILALVVGAEVSNEA